MRYSEKNTVELQTSNTFTPGRFGRATDGSAVVGVDRGWAVEKNMNIKQERESGSTFLKPFVGIEEEALADRPVNHKPYQYIGKFM